MIKRYKRPQPGEPDHADPTFRARLRKNRQGLRPQAEDDTQVPERDGDALGGLTTQRIAYHTKGRGAARCKRGPPRESQDVLTEYHIQASRRRA